MATLTHPHVSAEEVDQEHRQIGILFDDIRRELLSGRSRMPELRNRLGELSELLAGHFAHEEDGGYFEEIVEMSPRFAAKVQELQEEHHNLLAAVSQLRAQVNCAPDAWLWWRAIRVDFENFARQCREHEQQETSLVQSAYTEDIGALD